MNASSPIQRNCQAHHSAAAAMPSTATQRTTGRTRGGKLPSWANKNAIAMQPAGTPNCAAGGSTSR